MLATCLELWGGSGDGGALLAPRTGCRGGSRAIQGFLKLTFQRLRSCRVGFKTRGATGGFADAGGVDAGDGTAGLLRRLVVAGLGFAGAGDTLGYA